MIPKKIHFCWFGGAPLPPNVESCISSWRKNAPDFEIIRWDEKNFPVAKFEFSEQAYEHKKWAFVSDLARLWVLNKEGGIYFDTDVELLKPLDPYLMHDAFMGFEFGAKDPNMGALSTAIIGAEANNQTIRKFLDFYRNRKFITQGQMNLTPNTLHLTKVLFDVESVNHQEKVFLDGMTIYPPSFFSPKNYFSGETHRTKDTVSIHHYDGDWLSVYHKVLIRLKRFFLQIVK